MYDQGRNAKMKGLENNLLVKEVQALSNEELLAILRTGNQNHQSLSYLRRYCITARVEGFKKYDRSRTAPSPY